MEKSKVLELLDLTDEDMISEFDILDHFNNNNKLKGFICRQSDFRYGSMIITHINDNLCEQIIWGTPKQEYPFDRNGTFHWPEISQIEIWDKLDGTNILAYWYYHNNNKYLSFKTRLSPILSDVGYGSFYSLWMEYWHENPWIHNVIFENQNYNLSFELFGFRNPITIKYKFPLEINLLFGIRKHDHAIKPPSQLSLPEDTKIPQHIVVLDEKNLTNMYEELKQEISENNKEDLLVEGKVLYAFCNLPSWKQFKCKPDEILQIHWSHSGIPKRELWNTAINVFESANPTLRDFISLLKEEYTDQQIEKSKIRINNTFKEVEQHIRIVRKVNAVWILAKEKGFNIGKDKSETFRFMSKYFSKKEMRKVGSIVLKQLT